MEPALQPPPQAIPDRYIPVEDLGEGGMGLVVRAYDKRLRREVALKLIRPGLDPSSRKRMIREARAMAKLSHPHVVPVFDVILSEDEEGVIIAMEYVEGMTLKAWVRAEDRTWSDVVARFVEAGEGLAAAHDQGIIHRDFKAANVLVGRDRCRVTDFGLAQEAGARPSSVPELVSSTGGGDTDELTAAGTVVGTARFMAPEQHLATPLTPAADQYAFCLSLWQALTGKYPFVGRIAVEKHKGPPKWAGPADVPRHIVEALRRGLSPEPSRRWSSMRELMLVLQPPRRSRRDAVVAGVTVTVLGAAAIGLFGGEDETRCTEARTHLAGVWSDEAAAEIDAAMREAEVAYAVDTWIRVRPRLEAYAEAWVAGHTDACEATSVRGEATAAELDLRMTCLRRARNELGTVVEVLQQPDRALLERIDTLVAGLPDLSQCEDPSGLASADPPPRSDEADTVHVVQNHLDRAQTQRRAGRFDVAWEDVLAAAERAEGLEYLPVRLQLALETGRVRRSRGEYDEARRDLQDALHLGMHHRASERSAAVAAELSDLVGVTLAKPRQGLAYAKMATGLVGPDPTPYDRMSRRERMVGLHRVQGDYAAAELEARAALDLVLEHYDAQSSQVASARAALGGVLFDRGRYEEAEKLARQALETWQGRLGDAHPTVGAARSQVAIALKAQGKLAEAEAELRALLEHLPAQRGANHPRVAYTKANLANIHYARRAFEDAEGEYLEAIAILENAHGKEHPDVGNMRSNLGAMMDAQGNHEGAVDQFRGALRAFEATVGADHVDASGVRINLAIALDKTGRHDAARDQYEKALAALEQGVGPRNPVRARAAASAGMFFARQRRYDRAQPLLDDAWSRLRDAGPSMTRARVAGALARAGHELGRDPADVRELAQVAANYSREHPDVQFEEFVQASAILKRR